MERQRGMPRTICYLDEAQDGLHHLPALGAQQHEHGRQQRWRHTCSIPGMHLGCLLYSGTGEQQVAGLDRTNGLTSQVTLS